MHVSLMFTLPAETAIIMLGITAGSGFSKLRLWKKMNLRGNRGQHGPVWVSQTYFVYLRFLGGLSSHASQTRES
jgi:hypothetical protein